MLSTGLSRKGVSSSKCSPRAPFDADCPPGPPRTSPSPRTPLHQAHAPLHRAKKSPGSLDFLPVEISLQYISGEPGLALVDLDGPEQNVKMEKYLGSPAFPLFFLCRLSPQSQIPSLRRLLPPFPLLVPQTQAPALFSAEITQIIRNILSGQVKLKRS